MAVPLLTPPSPSGCGAGKRRRGRAHTGRRGPVRRVVRGRQRGLRRWGRTSASAGATPCSSSAVHSRAPPSWHTPCACPWLFAPAHVASEHAPCTLGRSAAGWAPCPPPSARGFHCSFESPMILLCVLKHGQSAFTQFKHVTRLCWL